MSSEQSNTRIFFIFVNNKNLFGIVSDLFVKDILLFRDFAKDFYFIIISKFLLIKVNILLKGWCIIRNKIKNAISHERRRLPQRSFNAFVIMRYICNKCEFSALNNLSDCRIVCAIFQICTRTLLASNTLRFVRAREV